MACRCVVSMVVAALAVAAFTAPAGAATVAPRGSGAREVAVARGPGGRGMVLWRSGRGGARRIEAAALAPGGAFGAAATVLQAPMPGSDPFGWLDANGGAHVLVPTQTSPSAFDILDVTRAPGAAAFGAPAVVVSGMSLVAAAANGRGDVALATGSGAGRIALRTARQGGPFGPGEDLAPGSLAQAPALAIDARGDLVVAYTDGEARDVVVRRGAAGAPLGPPQVVGRVGEHVGLGVGIDDAGTATVAFAAAAGGADVLTLVRAPAGGLFGPRQVLDRNRAGISVQVAAAGTTTAVAWSGSGFPNGLRVALARGGAAFGTAQAPAARAVATGSGDVSLAEMPAISVNPAGDVLFTYTYGPFGAIHQTLRRAGARGFTAPRVVSGLRAGFDVAATLLEDGRPLVAYTDAGAVLAAAAPRGRAVDLARPRVRMTAPSAHELRRRGTVTITVRCSAPCVADARARITTGRQRARAGGQVIEQPSVAPRALANGTRRVRFALSAEARRAFARTGRAQVKLAVTAANATGAAHTVHRTLEIGR